MKTRKVGKGLKKNEFKDKTSKTLNCIKIYILSEVPAIFYQIFVRSFSDFNQDGIGDLKGITQKLDYLAYLGVEGIWLSPIFPSPSYHKYDVTDYYAIDSEYGSMEDFEELIREADKRNIKILLDLVVSHTSLSHPWFLEAAQSKNSPYHDYYIWKSPKTIREMGWETRKATLDTGIKKPWHSIKGKSQKYYGIFSDRMPDLNLENRATRIEILEIARFWLRKGVYGFRLDAAKHLYPAWLPLERNTEFWTALQTELKKDFPDVYLVGEVWAPSEIVAPYFRGLNANFDFELCYDIRDVLIYENNYKNLIQKLLRSYAIYAQVNQNFIDATFLGNHDQERIASALKNNKRKIKAAFNLLMTLPGNPYIYYGEELGMEGKKPDHRIRESFIWNYSGNDYFRTTWLKGKYGNETKLKPLSAQSERKDSIFNHYKNMIAFRKGNPALVQILPVNLVESNIDHPKIISFIRTHSEQNLLVLQSLSKETIYVEINFSIKALLLSTQRSKISGKWAKLQAFGLLVLVLN